MKAADFRHITIIGAGIMGKGIALSLARAGLSVGLVDREQATLEMAMAHIRSHLALFETFHLLDVSTETVLSRIHPVMGTHLNDVVQTTDMAIEAIPEILEMKKDLFARLDEARSDLILTSNTSSFSITTLAEDLRHPERVVGLHFFNPAHIIPAVEIHHGRETAIEALGIVREVMLGVGKKPVLVRKEVPGSIINRLTGAVEREIDYLLDEGVVTPEDLDAAVKASFGFRLACVGPMQAEDMIGLDTAARVSERLFGVLSNKTAPSPKLLEKVARGELGIKSGKGWYDYTDRPRKVVEDEINRRLLKQLAQYEAWEGKSS